MASDDHHQVIHLHKVEAGSYYVRLTFRELWRAWRHGISLPRSRVRPELPFTAGGGGDWYVGQWTVPEGVTSVDIEVTGEGGARDRGRIIDLSEGL